MDNSVQVVESPVVRFNPWANNRRETHLEFTVFYAASDGRTRWANGVMAWGNYADAETLQHDVLALQTTFVQQRWLRIEVCVPNRDAYGHIQPGFIKDTGVLLATRQLQ